MTTRSHTLRVEPGKEYRIQGISLGNTSNLFAVLELAGVPKDDHYIDIAPFVNGTHMSRVIDNDKTTCWIKIGPIWWPMLERKYARADQLLNLSWTTDCGDHNKDVTVYLTISFHPDQMEVKLEWTTEPKK